MNGEIELYSKLQNPIEAIDRMGEWFSKSGMFGCEKLEQGKILAMACLAEGKSPIQISREYHLIEGHLTDRADSMLAKFNARGGKHRILARTGDSASVELSKDGQTHTFTLTWPDAQLEPFVWSNYKDNKGTRMPKKNWATPRARMQTLWARVISDGVRTMDPGIVAGLLTPEEVVDDTDSAPSGPASSILVAPVAESAAPAPPIPVSAPDAPSAPASKARPLRATRGPNGGLSPETVAQLLSVVPPDLHVVADSWLLAQGWIPGGGDLSQLSIARAERILNNPSGFCANLRAQKPAGPSDPGVASQAQTAEAV